MKEASTIFGIYLARREGGSEELLVLHENLQILGLH
jgi:hypothetical protein